MPTLIIIAGPTASGKTAASVELARTLGTDVLSFDSRQFYSEMRIGTARPQEEELQGVRHHFLGDRSITQPFNASDFEKESIALLKQLFKNHDEVVAVGGTGLYMKALCEGLDPIPTDPAVRQVLERTFQEEGLSPLRLELQELDPEFCTYGDIENPVRVIRALEAYKVSGKPMSQWHREHRPSKRDFDVVKLGLETDRQELYARIDMRVLLMMEQGLLEEARSLLEYRQLRTLNTVGYQELFTYLDGECSLEEAVELIQRNTRRYAKRQLTWFRKEDMTWLPRESFVEEAMKVIQYKR